MRLLLLATIAAALPAADADFNGRWIITPEQESRARVWWLEVTGAGTPGVMGKFVGAPGGDMDTIPEISVSNGELRFAFMKNYKGREASKVKGVYTARLAGEKLQGQLDVEGHPDAARRFSGVRAPVIADKDDANWKPGKTVALFNGKDLSNWRAMIPGKPLGWEVQSGVMTNVAGANNLVSEEKFWNFELQCEFRIGAKSNGGIGLRGRYEVQIIDDFGKPPGTHGTGALYSRIVPSKNASRKPGEWQTYDIRLVGRTVTVTVNGEKVIDRGEIDGLTAMGHDPNEAEPGPISLQGDHGSVEIRKLTVTPLTR